MSSLSDVFTEKERTNWLKAWLAVDIAKSGLEPFVENEAKLVQACMYNTISSGGQAPGTCNGCLTANLLKCPTPGTCNKRGARGTCKVMHDSNAKQPRPCPLSICDKVLIEIEKAHRYTKPSWRNTSADQWASNSWQIAKAYLPPDGYADKSSVKETDFNGIISFMMNCKHFDSKFSFPIPPGKPNNSCLLTKARDIGRIVRHSSQCKVTDRDLQDIFTTLNDLLTDPMCLANDGSAQEAVRKLRELANDVFKITTAEMIQLLKAAQDTLKQVEHSSHKTLDEIRVYLKRCKKDLKQHVDTCKQELDQHTENCKGVLDGYYRKPYECNYEQCCEGMSDRIFV
ncbi:uncharacterized protein CXorf38-like [Dreissena polymorpha]|uniref:uncharacterized protein CXorf38-like n=1 Tax=Dreissena polymorpha TaxID=45954 RepID=UPI00226407EC|nr:uncharacterized protein CXorf38-like [Dreissena polymorpha]XP_052220053.1 uncharacterized protein CXorf38-like [Dreissena polymorpha]